ncbi:Rieske 2Fe-2S domain-containing protein [Piscinibacter sakaiensis]|uniref:Rieske 2Fe-2S domain-containing protein n=1 Tax=Piscinibacter sakaiensis TaxID=1547922 RepID=UPI00372D52CA
MRLWRAADGRLQAADDRCPHRGTRLSLGRVVDGALECPYHGWQFGDGGRCVRIPAAPGFEPPAGHGLGSHAVQERHGLVWLRVGAAGEGAVAELPSFEAEDDARLRKLLCGPYRVATSAPRIVENFLDLAHFGFVHEGWLGDRAHTEVDDHGIEPTPQGFAVVGCRAWQPRSNQRSSTGRWIDYRYEVTGPYAAQLLKLPEDADAERDAIGLFVAPLDPERSLVWFRLAVTDLASSDEALRAFQHAIFTQDQPILESQQPKALPVYAGGEVHHAADRASAAYRRLLRERGITFGTV